MKIIRFIKRLFTHHIPAGVIVTIKDTTTSNNDGNICVYTENGPLKKPIYIKNWGEFEKGV